MLHVQTVLYKLVKNIQKYIRQKLRGEIAKRQSDSFDARREAAHDIFKEPNDAFIGDVFIDNPQQNIVFDGREELPHIALQYPSYLPMVLRRLARKLGKPIQRPMRALAQPARKRISDEDAVERLIELSINRTVNDPVRNGCFMDIPFLWVKNDKRFIGRMTISHCFQTFM